MRKEIVYTVGDISLVGEVLAEVRESYKKVRSFEPIMHEDSNLARRIKLITITGIANGITVFAHETDETDLSRIVQNAEDQVIRSLKELVEDSKKETIQAVLEKLGFVNPTKEDEPTEDTIG